MNLFLDELGIPRSSNQGLMALCNLFGYGRLLVSLMLPLLATLVAFCSGGTLHHRPPASTQIKRGHGECVEIRLGPRPICPPKDTRAPPSNSQTIESPKAPPSL